ncbi:MAG: glycosyltransferase family 4 protein [Actinomycetota bacterium]
MRIAQIAPCWLTVPPRGYGGTERVISCLADGLAARGHEVTLFAAGGSGTSAKLVSYYEKPLGMVALVGQPFLELPHVLDAYARAEEFDVIHDHTFPFGPSIGAHLPRPPVVHTLHGPPWYPNVKPIYQFLARRLHYVAISQYQRIRFPELNYAATVYHGIDLDSYPFRSANDGYLLFVGRMSPEKGPELAVEAARRLRRRLVMVVKMIEPAEEEYFESTVRPLLTGSEQILGEISAEEKMKLYAGASCTLMPIQWPEPFGLVMVESMACGTPVVAFRNGSVPEIIEHGKTGFIADDLDELVALAARGEEIDPAACRERVEKRFSLETMLDGYEAVFSKLVP